MTVVISRLVRHTSFQEEGPLGVRFPGHCGCHHHAVGPFTHGAVSCGWQQRLADRRTAGDFELQEQEEANQHGMLRPTSLHCPRSHLTLSPGQLPFLWNNGSPGDNVASSLEAASGHMPSWHQKGRCGFQPSGHLQKEPVEVWSLLAR